MRTNAERARRAETALRAYIAETGDDIRANGVDTWLRDLMCDLRHFAERMEVEIYDGMGLSNYEAERDEDPEGVFIPDPEWYVEA